MKRSTKYLSGIFLGLVLTLSAVPGRTQILKNLRVTIPFNFSVGDKEFEAGDYIIQRAGETGSLIIRNEGGHGQQFVFGIPMETNKTGNRERLVFHRYGNQYFLSQIWLSGDEDGHKLVRGAQEKNAAAKQPASDEAVVGQ